MTETTPLDVAHERMQAAPQDDTLRLSFFETLASTELFLMLTEEAQGGSLSPEIFEISDNSFVLIFDREDRLAGFVGRAVPYAALPGRAIAGLLAGRNLGLGLNLETAPSSMLLPPQAVDWLAQTLAHAPQTAQGRPRQFHAPTDVPEALNTALDTKLASAAGLAQAAYLVGVTYDDSRKTHLLAFAGAEQGAEHALAGAVNQALTFSGVEAGALDVVFLAQDDPMLGRLIPLARPFDLPAPQPSQSRCQDAPAAPGSDPEKPPILR
ncbi:SseB family protein [Primorskyibacter flagellatus]|uniref:SseB protein N-terminal domain-containing protein n=1 Tax=Primorskyibacter flagellatus TaxID=1387277 RepID=A0A1W2AMD0_9RHOB|nr:SseB family protein [Primorskyibacter flagellatus]SMC61846.1 SseB protein N-terminal domain-containing protein [Primorskyibacter flagellatus]